MKPSLQFRQSQHLALTPQLQQSIRLLQLSTLELDQVIEEALAQNPLLERLDDPLAGHERLGAQGDFDAAVQPGSGLGADEVAHHGDDAAPDGRDGDGRDGGASDGSAGDAAGMHVLDADRGAPAGDVPGDGLAGPAGEPSTDGSAATADDAGDSAGLDVDPLRWDGEPGRGDDGDDRGSDQVSHGAGSLAELLQQQLAGLRCNDVERVLVRVLIDELDDDGYLRTPMAELEQSLPASTGVEADDWRTALALLHSFEPAGVGARSLSECLRLQLPAMAARSEVPAAVEALARQICAEHLELLAARDYVRMCRLLRCDEAALREAQRLIQSLDPRPGSRYGSVHAGYVVPDVFVRRTRDGWRVSLNPDVLPRLRVNDDYARLLAQQRPRRTRGAADTPAPAPAASTAAGHGVAPDTKEAAAGGTDGTNTTQMTVQLQEARWLVKNVHQRFETILRVSQEIVDRQKAFFSHGEVAMRPLVLREIADALGLHESTISRVTTQKFMATPFGTVELKYFFGSHVATESGGEASSTAIRALIRQLVEKEDPHHPLSDSRIAELLGEQGFVLARRTVAKYRELLRIGPASRRKSL